MVSPAMYPLVTISASAALFTAGGYLGYLCSDTVFKIYEYAKCSVCDGKLARDGDQIVKQLKSFDKLDNLIITVCSTALSLTITFFALSLFATSAPAFVSGSLLASAIIIPVVIGLIRSTTGRHRTITIPITQDKAKVAIDSLPKITSRHYQYTGFPWPWADQPKDGAYYTY